jgi:hypothetical protein
MKTKRAQVVTGNLSRAEVSPSGDGIVLHLGTLSLRLDLDTADDLAETLERALLLASVTASEQQPALAVRPPHRLS